MNNISNKTYVLRSFLNNIAGPLWFFIGSVLNDWTGNILGKQLDIFNSPIAKFLPLLVIAGVIIYGLFKTLSQHIKRGQWKRETYQHIDKNIQSYVSQGVILSLMLSFNILCPGNSGDLSTMAKFFGIMASLMPTVVGLYQANQIYNWVDRIYHDAHDTLEKIRLGGRTRFTEASVISDLMTRSSLFRDLHPQTQLDFVRQKMKIWVDELIDKGENVIARKNRNGEMTISFFQNS